MQNQSKNNGNYNKRSHRKWNETSKDFALSEISKCLGVAARSLVSQKTVGNAPKKCICAKGYHQRRQFDASHEIAVQETTQRAQQKSCQRCDPNIDSQVM